MRTEDWLNALNAKLKLPPEYKREILSEYESHLYNAKFDPDFNIENFGNINLLVNQIMKAKEISTLKLLTLKSTWIFLLFSILSIIIPFGVINYIFMLGSSWSWFLLTRLNKGEYMSDSVWVFGFWLTSILTFFVIVILQFLLNKRWEYNKQKFLVYALTFLLICFLYSYQTFFTWRPNMLGVFYFLYSMSFLVITTSIYYKVSPYIFNRLKILEGTKLNHILNLLFLVFLGFIAINGITNIGGIAARLFYSDLLKAGDIVTMNIKSQKDSGDLNLEDFSSPEIEKFGLIRYSRIAKCWDINVEDKTQGCDYDTKFKILDSKNCTDKHETENCISLGITDDNNSFSIDISINNRLRCFSELDSGNKYTCLIIRD